MFCILRSKFKFYKINDNNLHKSNVFGGLVVGDLVKKSRVLPVNALFDTRQMQSCILVHDSISVIQH